MQRTQLLTIFKCTNRLFNRNFSSTKDLTKKKHCCKILVVGGGTAGCIMAAKCSKVFRKHEIIIVEPREVHVYKPAFTFVGGGILHLRNIIKPMLRVLPDNATWIRDSVAHFCPNNNAVILKSGTVVHYEFMVIAIGIMPDFNKICRFEDALRNSPNVSTIYSPKYVRKTFECFQEFEGGNAVFTSPAGAVSCLAASLKICLLGADYFRRRKQLRDVTVIYATAKSNIFPVELYEASLNKIAERLGVNIQLQTELIEIIPDSNKAIFRCVNEPEKKICLKYSMLHVTAAMSPPDALKNCKELVTKDFVDIDRKTLQHKKYMNVFAIGDCINAPYTKTASGATVQAYVAFNNLMRVIEGKRTEPLYNGYTACPIITSYDTILLAEYDYKLNPTPTFPFNIEKEKKWLFQLHQRVIPKIYWNWVLNGNWDGPENLRNIFHLKFSKRNKDVRTC